MENFYSLIKFSNELLIFIILKELSTIIYTDKVTLNLEHHLHYYQV